MRYLLKRSFVCPFCKLDHEDTVSVCPKTDKRLSVVPELGGNTLDGKYKVESVLGSGGMGVVYEGLHRTINRKVAIKFLSPESVINSEVRERFVNEAKIAASLGHKNIVAVLDLGETGVGVPYIVMEYLEGESLGDVLERETRMSVPRAVGVTLQILDGLHAVHSEEIIHRDLKPENVFMARQSGGEEIVKLLDFGISRLTTSDNKASRLTEAGRVYGTPYYVSPEQAEGRLDVDHRADIYSVGVLLYEMTTGQLPFRATSYATLMVDIITRPAPDPRDHLPELPVDLVAIITRALAKRPESRFAHAKEMARALEQIVGRGLRSSNPSHPGASRVSENPPPQRDSLTGYRILLPEIPSGSAEGPLARARKRRTSQPPLDDAHVDIPSPPPEVDQSSFPSPSKPPGRRSSSSKPPMVDRRPAQMIETRPIPRSDSMRQTPTVVPENARDLRVTPPSEKPPEDGGAKRRIEDEPREEPEDDIDRGWDF